MKATTGKGPLLGPLTVTLVEHPALAADVVDRLIKQLRARYPMKTDFSAAANPKPSLRDPFADALRGLSPSPLKVAIEMSGLGTWMPPSEAAIARYHDEVYPLWLEKVRTFLTEVHAHLSAPHGYAVVSVSLENTGIVPAEGLLVEIETLGGLLLAEEKPRAERAPLALPEPPEPPAWRMATRGSLLSDVMGTVARAQAAEVPLPYPLHDLHRAEHDPHAFYWRDRHGKGPTARWGFQCQEFRHGRDPEVFDMIVFAPRSLASGIGAVRFTASARNLPQQVEHVISVRIERQTGDTGAEVEALMPVDRLWLRAR